MTTLLEPPVERFADLRPQRGDSLELVRDPETEYLREGYALWDEAVRLFNEHRKSVSTDVATCTLELVSDGLGENYSLRYSHEQIGYPPSLKVTAHPHGVKATWHGACSVEIDAQGHVCWEFENFQRMFGEDTHDMAERINRGFVKPLQEGRFRPCRPGTLLRAGA